MAALIRGRCSIEGDAQTSKYALLNARYELDMHYFGSYSNIYGTADIVFRKENIAVVLHIINLLCKYFNLISWVSFYSIFHDIFLDKI